MGKEESLMVGLIVTSIRAALHYIFYRVAVAMIFIVGKAGCWVYGSFIKPKLTAPCRTKDHYINNNLEPKIHNPADDNFETPCNPVD